MTFPLLFSFVAAAPTVAGVAVDVAEPELREIVVAELTLRLPKTEVAIATPDTDTWSRYLLRVESAIGDADAQFGAAVPLILTVYAPGGAVVVEHDIPKQTALQKTGRAIAVLAAGAIERHSRELDPLFHPQRAAGVGVMLGVGGTIYTGPGKLTPSASVGLRARLVAPLWVFTTLDAGLPVQGTAHAVDFSVFETTARVTLQVAHTISDIEARAALGVGVTLTRGRFEKAARSATESRVKAGPCAIVQGAYHLAPVWALVGSVVVQRNLSYPVFLIDGATAYDRGPWMVTATAGLEMLF